MYKLIAPCYLDNPTWFVWFFFLNTEQFHMFSWKLLETLKFQLNFDKLSIIIIDFALCITVVTFLLPVRTG